MRILWRSSKDTAEHVLPASRALRITNGAGWRRKAGLYNHSPGRSPNKHVSLAGQLDPRKLVSATVFVRNRTWSNGASISNVGTTLCVRTPEAAVSGQKRWYLILPGE